MNKRNALESQAIEAYKRLLIPLTSLLSSILGLWGLAYFLGWKRADSYYSAFGAKWITSEISVTEILSLSYWPILALLIGLSITLSDIAEIFHNKKRVKLIIITSIVSLVFLYILSIATSYNEYHDRTALLDAMILVSIASLTGVNFGLLAVELFFVNSDIEASHLFSLFVLLLCFISATGSLGKAEGLRDSHPKQSRLYTIKTNEGYIFRFLQNSTDFIYAAEICENQRPKVKIISKNDINFIQR